ncbi:uncharacterized protein MELLADRAFT_73304 [Melampsora larici-populina 98AG31]|uniref:Uncharacterized protein n=1 Tax=Melampsora larici-populina (strain 98AG31 / pathotype 3-4-7) TaxID=747676 RepID=F4S668_MELLP|nr:uncharacterized protein MELLADRAFT_73304 [Melampsora larici-populina 98AG31]EGF99894.1 hypothetical protein MELLADRAFT_73304 [Melampsora larici-populina 98AG31]
MNQVKEDEFDKHSNKKLFDDVVKKIYVEHDVDQLLQIKQLVLKANYSDFLNEWLDYNYLNFRSDDDHRLLMGLEV